MRLVLIGPPGSGKGTQAKRLCEEFGLLHISTGVILREAMRANTPAGRIAHPYVSKGNLAPDDVVNEVVQQHFQEPGRPTNFVMDGYPRTVAQAIAFDRILDGQSLELDATIAILVDDEEIIHRVSGRWNCSNLDCKATYHSTLRPPREPGVCDLCGSKLEQREDDKEETVRNRLKVYHRNLDALLAHYRRQGKLHEVCGEGDVGTVFARIAKIVYDRVGAEKKAARDLAV